VARLTAAAPVEPWQGAANLALLAAGWVGRHPHAAPAVRRAAADPRASVRQRVAAGLAASVWDGADDVLAALMADPDPEVRAEAAQARSRRAVRAAVGADLAAGAPGRAAARLTDYGALHDRLTALGPDETASVLADLRAVERAGGPPELAPWATFLRRHAHRLAEGGAVALLQAALADGGGSPVGRAVREWQARNAVRDPWLERLDEAAPRLVGHAQRVILRGLRFAGLCLADGALHAAAWAGGEAENGIVLRLDPHTGRVLARSPRPRRRARDEPYTLGFAVAIRAVTGGDGSDALVTGFFGGVQRWSLPSLELVAEHVVGDRLVALLPGDGDVTVATANGRLLALDAALTAVRWEAQPHPGGARALAALGTDHVASAGEEAELVVTDRRDGRTVRRVATRLGPITHLATLPDGALVAGGACDWLDVFECGPGADGAPEPRRRKDGAWSWRRYVTGPPLRLPSKDGLQALAAADGASVCAVAGGSRRHITLRLFDAATGRLAAQARGDAKNVRDLVILADEPVAVTAEGQDGLRLWRLDAPARDTSGEETDAVNGLALAPDGDVLVTSDSGGRVAVRALENGRLRRTLQPSGPSVPQAAVDPSGRYAAGRDTDGRVSVWRLRDGRLVTRAPCTCLLDAPFAPNRFVFVDDEGALCELDAAARSGTVGSSPHGKRRVTAMAGRGAREQVATGDEDGGIVLWDLADRSFEHLEGHAKEIAALVFAPDGERLLSVAHDGSLRLWSAGGDALATAWTPPGSFGLCADLDHERIVVGDTAGRVSVYGDRLAREVRLDAHDGMVWTVALGPGGRAASGGTDRMLRVWDLASGEELAAYAFDGSVARIAWLDPGRLVATTGAGDVAFLRLHDGRLP
jgi:WD40 repeat protein